MLKIKLFKLTKETVAPISANPIKLEKQLQEIFEQHLQALLNIRFLATEYVLNGNIPGRIDTLGVDSNNRPVIIEYKRNINMNVINQGMVYVNWLLDHKADFSLLVMEKLETKLNIDWTMPRLLCIAEDFNKYDTGVADVTTKMSIELIRFCRYEDDLFVFEPINKEWEEDITEETSSKQVPKKDTPKKTTDENKSNKSSLGNNKSVFTEIKNYIFSLGKDISVIEVDKPTRKKNHPEISDFIFKRKENFIYVRPYDSSGSYCGLWLNLKQKSIADLQDEEYEFEFDRGKHCARKYLPQGNANTGIASLEDLELIKPFIQKAYELS